MTDTAEVVVRIAVLVVVALAALGGMWWGWQRRARRTAAIVPVLATVPPVSERDAPLIEPVRATYVSTTLGDDLLERVVAHGLGRLSPVVVRVDRDGVLLERTGAPDVYVPASDVVGVDRAPGMAGKVVGGEGLVVLRWRAPSGATPTTSDDLPDPVLLATGLRVDRAERAPLSEALRSLTGTRRATDVRPEEHA